jgi:hypothetical protein
MGVDKAVNDKPNQPRDEVLLRLLKTPPSPHKPLGKRRKRGADGDESDNRGESAPSKTESRD